MRPEAEDREKKAALPITGIAMPLTRRSCPGPSGERTNATITPIWPCETLCAPIMGGAESLAPPKQAQANVGRCSAIAGSGLSPSWALYGGRKEKQDKGRGRLRRLRPVTPPRSAGRDNGLREVQQVAGNGVKNGRVISLLWSISPKPYCHKEKTGVRAGIARVFQRDGPRYAPISPQKLRRLKQ